MALSLITLTGFKSFAKKSELSFSHNVTAIVGPNGSGKSNIAEAFRFVLGEQSVKSMRGKKGEDLIWGGSDGISRKNQAQVTIEFQNEKRALPLDTDTVTIERVVHRDGQNDYKINGHTVRLKDVHELLSAGNVGPTGHHIISQGEADRVLVATPTERRNMIEDALGLKVYQYKKAEAEKKLVSTKDNITEVERLRKEIAPHLKYLKRELDDQAKAKAVKIELIDLYAEYLKREDIYLAKEYDRLVVEEDNIKEQCQKYEKEIAELEQKKELVSVDTTNKQEESTLKKDWQEKREKVQAVEKKLRLLQGKQMVLKEQKEQSEEKSQEEMVPVKDVVWELREYKKQIREGETIEDVGSLQKIYLSLQKRIDTFLTKITQTKNDNEDKQEDIENKYQLLLEELSSTEKEYDKVKASLGQAEEIYNDYISKRESQRSEHSDVLENLYTKKAELNELKITKERTTHELSIVTRERDAFKAELQEAVVLIGRGVANYYTHVVCDESGQELAEEDLLNEPREKQRERRQKLEKLKLQLETFGDGSDVTIEEEYQQTKERDDFLAREVEDLRASVEKLEHLIDELTEKLDEQFKEGFQKVQQEFQNFFALMFGGGTASLESVTVGEGEDSKKGVEIKVSLPNKRIQGLGMLSGGERALLSIALVFAMSQIYPPLFIVLDETDAALDEANSKRYGDLIEVLAERSQLILITHNRETMSRAGVLYGVTMGADGVSNLLSVQLEDAIKNAK